MYCFFIKRATVVSKNLTQQTVLVYKERGRIQEN